MGINHFIWDFDGTLFDTYSGIMGALTATLQDNGLQFDRNELYRLVKTQSVGFATDYFGQLYGRDGKMLNQQYQAKEHELQQDPKPYPEAPLILKAIQLAGKHNYLYTHRDAKVWDFLEQADLKSVFSGGVTSDDHFPRKPDPTALKAILARYQLDPKETAMIGDRPIDVQAGQNAGIQTIYFDVDAFHQDAGADQTIAHLSDLQKLL